MERCDAFGTVARGQEGNPIVAVGQALGGPEQRQSVQGKAVVAQGGHHLRKQRMMRPAGDEMADIKRLFTPEFRNRLDATISFAALSESVIARVVDKFLMQLENQLHEKKVEATFSEALRRYLAKKGFDPLMGARPMARLIQDTIRRALADELLFGRLASGGHVDVDIDASDKLVLNFDSNASDAPTSETTSNSLV